MKRGSIWPLLLVTLLAGSLFAACASNAAADPASTATPVLEATSTAASPSPEPTATATPFFLFELTPTATAPPTPALAVGTSATPTTIPPATPTATNTPTPISALAPTPNPAPNFGRWIVDEDSDGVVAELQSDTGTDPDGSPIVLELHCEPEDTGVRIRWGSYYLDAPLVLVLYRIGSEPPISHFWPMPQWKDETIYPYGANRIPGSRGSLFAAGSPEAFLDRLIDASTFAAKVTTQDNVDLTDTATFDLTGIVQVAQKMKTACAI